MILNSPYISGSLTVTGNATIQGQLTVTGSLSGTASLASNSLLLEGTGSVGFATTASLLAVSSSQQQISSSLLSLTASYNALSSSYTSLSASYNVASSSFSTRITSDSSSLSSRTTQIENVYATTGSNSFTGVQNFSNTCTPNSFTAGASLYTAGGLRVTQDTYFSSSVYIKGNVTVYGTQSVAYISSSQLDIGTNIITVNTATPSIRYGGLSVFDSGSTGLTGSILWDSELNRWIYSNASGSGGGATYGGGMFISGPRNSQGIGCEQGTTACMLLVGQGGDHLTSSMIYHSSTVTCIPGASITSTGAACFASSVTAKNLILNGTATTALDLTSGTFSYGLDLNNNVFLRQKNVAGTLGLLLGLSVDDNLYVRGFSDVNIQVNNGTTALALASTGVATFSNNILIGAGKYLGYSSTAYMTPEDNIQGARVKTPGAFLVESTGATFCSSARAIEYLKTKNNSSNLSYLEFERYSNTQAFSFIQGNGENTTGFLKFYTSDALRLTILGNGNVGIGTCVPSAALHILRSAYTGNQFRTYAELQSAPTTLSYTTSDGFGLILNMYEAIGGVPYTRYADIVANTGDISDSTMRFFTKPYNANATERMRITSCGRVGIGQVSPGVALSVAGQSEPWQLALTTVTGTAGAVIGSPSANALAFGDWSGNQTMLITSGGDIGIGTNTTISSKLTIYEGDIRLYKKHVINCTGTWASNIFFTDEVDRKGAAIVGERTAWDGAPMALGFETGGVGTITRRMTITSDGNQINYCNIFLNLTSVATVNSNSQSIGINGVNYMNRGSGVGLYHIAFGNGGNLVGTITSCTTATQFNTTSDYRLKTDLKNYNGICLINQIKTYDFAWKLNDARTYGVIAHELSDIIPYAVTGEKDALDERGCILPQAVDYSKIVTPLIKAVQEQQCTICSQATMINVLKTCLGIS